jgi:hypothetical protein
MTMEPVLNKYSNVVEDNNERTIFIITKANLQPITKALTQTTNSITAATQLPELVLMGLVGAYDVILQKLVKTGLKYEDRIAFGSDKTVRLRDLKGFSTIQEAMDFLADKEVESILQQDHFDQLNEINKLFSVKIDTEDRCVRQFLEICERRNLFAHNAGLVNARYLAKCKSFGIDVSTVKLGEHQKSKDRTIRRRCL